MTNISTSGNGSGGKIAWATPVVEEILGIRPIDIITDLRLTLLRNGYQPVPVLGKRCLLLEWTTIEITETVIRSWAIEHPKWMNTGIRTDFAPAFDADVDNAEVAQTIRQYAEAWLGKIQGRKLFRTGRAPRVLIPFRCDVPFSKIRWELNDSDALEFLGTGNQFICDGIHPDTGRPYDWQDGAAPWIVPRDKLPLFDGATARAFINGLFETIDKGHRGFVTRPAPSFSDVDNVVEIAGRIRIRDWQHTPIANGCSLDLRDYEATSVAEVRAALYAIDPDIDRRSWNTLGFSMKDELGEFGVQMWDGWSRLGSKCKPREMQGQCRSILKSKSKGREATVRTLFKLANKADPNWRDKIDVHAPLHEMELPRDESAWVNEPVPEDAILVDLEHWREAVNQDDSDNVTITPDPVEESIGAEPAANADNVSIKDEAAPAVEARPLTPKPAAQVKSKAKKWILSSGELVREYVPPEYVVIGLLQRRFVYSFTGQTGTGKTAILLYLAACAALGRQFANYKLKKVRVLYLASENSDDIIMRWINLADKMKFDIDAIEVYFVRADLEKIKLSSDKTKLRFENELYDLGGDFGLVIVDTGPAFFDGIDENANVEMGDHARMFRSMAKVIPGEPCVVISCHPPKNAGPDQLIPRGGGAFVAEVDGNLTAAKKGSIITMHWQGKFRGPDFAPLDFLIKTVTCDGLRDSDGQHIPTVMVKPATEQEQKAQKTTSREEELTILDLLRSTPDASLSALAEAADWKMHDGQPNKMRVSRAIDRLEKAKLIKQAQDGYRLTKAGENALSESEVF